MFRLNCDLVVTPDREIYLLGRQSFFLNKEVYATLPLLQKMSVGVTQAELERLRQHSFLGPFLTRLEERDLIRPYNPCYVDSALERSEVFLARMSLKGTDALSLIGQNTVAILGCGGVGANIAFNLCIAGVTNFILADYDVVAASNLNRQFPYTARDVGLFKIDALATHLISLNNTVECKKIHKLILSEADVAEAVGDTCNLIICAIDHPPVMAKRFVTQHALSSATDAVFAGAGYDTVNAGPLLTGARSKHLFLHALDDLMLKVDVQLTSPLTGSLGSVNSFVTSIVSNQLIAYLTGIAAAKIVNKELVIDPWSLLTVQENVYE